ncbi:MAG TPA: NAD(P)/FAD-dependent oxidoreductase, partial [Actinomycetota bacterium]
MDRRDVDIAIIGTGFSGLGAAIRLKREGFEDFVVLERDDDVGGTWRDNHYPGLACDIPSHVYSFSFELKADWTRGFAPGWEILDYLRATAKKFGVWPHIRFRHDVRSAAWDETERRWRIETSAGTFTARVLISGAGPLTDPQIPTIPGMERFGGTAFHSARWNHQHDLTGERVAVIGTGASAIQFVPEIQPRVGQLHLFQRTAPWVIPRYDHQITEMEHFLLRTIPFAPEVVRGALYTVMETRFIGFRYPAIMRAADRLARLHLARQVSDPDLRRKLTPGYIMGCKRILVSDNYYPALTQPNVDVRTDGVAEVRDRSLVTGAGEEVQVDTVIFGTGFHVTDPPIANRIYGVGGVTLRNAWRPSMQAYKGTTVAGFPNLFLILGPNTGLGHNSQIYIIESQLNYVVDALRGMRRHGVDVVDVRREVQERYNEALQRDFEGTVWTAGHCQSWYLD